MKEINFFGIYLAPFVLYFFITLVIYFVLRKFFDRWEVEKWFWHRHLFDFAVFIIILSLVGLVL